MENHFKIILALIENSFLESSQPIIRKNSKVLILGTLPSKKSLEPQQYYGYSRHAFRRILFT